MKKLVKYFRKILIGDYREKKLAETFVKLLYEIKNKKELKILDYGSGFNPTITYYMKDLIKLKNLKVKIDCYDLYNDFQLKELNKNTNVSFFHIRNLKKNNLKYDFCMISDTLHHIGIDNKVYIKQLLLDLKKKSEHIIIKDHFEYNYFSRQCLRMMDFVGNYSSGVNVPKRYYNEEIFQNLMKEINF